MVHNTRQGPRARIILETSDRRKSAIVEAADLQGASLTDWFEEQVSFALPPRPAITPGTESEVLNPSELQQEDAVLQALSAQDWAFTDDDTRYLTHDIHPYPAKFIPQIPAHLISRLSLPGDLVCDPFGGSATTAVEAVRLGRRTVSLDANPISALIGRVKTGYMSTQVRGDLEQLCAAVEGHIIGSETDNAKWLERVSSQYAQYVPKIANLDKWFDLSVIGELSLLRHLIESTTAGLARDAAYVGLSRIIIRVSNQDSETRYVSVSKRVTPLLTLRAYLESIRTISRRLELAATTLQFADAHFIVGDSRTDLPAAVGDNTVDLIVTSPPYPNATDYHLYHRFRLFWLGFDPRDLAQIEIGSHLRHQRDNTGFEDYSKDMARAMEGCTRILSPGRYAVFVVGDAIFKGQSFSTSATICDNAKACGLSVVGVIDRPIHQTKRSFAKPGRRARSEQLVVLRKPDRKVTVRLNPPYYRMWKYEQVLRLREIAVITGQKRISQAVPAPLDLLLGQPALWHLRRLTFTPNYNVGDKGVTQPTWQKVLENGDADPATRKDPKYATHGLHPFKGKFYPQLAKSLLNISGAPIGGTLLDPFCGSGTALLEGMLNGYAGFGCDFNPLAAKIARAKTAILTVPRNIVDLSMRAFIDKLAHRRGGVPAALDQFAALNHDELRKWFPAPVLFKLNWLISQVRLLGNPTLVDFFEIIISSLIREVSDQDPADLRIRRRKEPLEDAPVLERFHVLLKQQHSRLQRYWTVAGRQAGRSIAPKIIEGDSRQLQTFETLGLGTDTVDCVVTSPPYATALPYIDTDRLSLLTIMDVPQRVRADLEEALIGSREIRTRDKAEGEALLLSKAAYEQLPAKTVDAIRHVYHTNKSTGVGFRRANMPALLWRYFVDMKKNLAQIQRVLKPGGKAFYVVGDSRTTVNGSWLKIETCDNIAEIGKSIGLKLSESIDIDVTTENYKHAKNAITKNSVIIFEKV